MVGSGSRQGSARGGFDIGKAAPLRSAAFRVSLMGEGRRLYKIAPSLDLSDSS